MKRCLQEVNCGQSADIWRVFETWVSENENLISTVGRHEKNGLDHLSSNPRLSAIMFRTIYVRISIFSLQDASVCSAGSFNPCSATSSDIAFLLKGAVIAIDNEHVIIVVSAGISVWAITEAPFDPG